MLAGERKLNRSPFFRLEMGEGEGAFLLKKMEIKGKKREEKKNRQKKKIEEPVVGVG